MSGILALGIFGTNTGNVLLVHFSYHNIFKSFLHINAQGANKILHHMFSFQGYNNSLNILFMLCILYYKSRIVIITAITRLLLDYYALYTCSGLYPKINTNVLL